jgi:hypothetical protein
MTRLVKAYSLLILCLFLLAPISAQAASLFFDTDSAQINAGDSIVINVRLNTEALPINAVDGQISLTLNKKKLTIKEFSLANSALAIWPLRPSLSQDGKSVSFVGGVAGGLISTDAILFKIIVSPAEAGNLFINPVNFLAYMNDGQGTAVDTSKQALNIEVQEAPVGSVPKDNWQDLLVADHTPPEPFTINLYQDPETNNGQKFIDFYAIDNQSGVDYYEVLESGLDPVRSGSPYTLQNQAEPVKVTVIAHDKAGNLRSVTYASEAPKASAITTITNALHQSSSLTIKIIIIIVLLLTLSTTWLIIRFRHSKL